MKIFRMRSAALCLLASAAAVLVLPGCRREVPLMEHSTVVGRSVEGRPIEAVVLGNGPDVTMVLATIHGNENAGTPLVQNLDSLLRRRPELLAGRKVILVPAVNPDGYRRNMRTNARGIDLNRNFAASNRENNRRYGTTELSEPESKTIVALLEQHKPSRIVSIHQPLEVIDFDGPAEELARHMGEYSTLPVKRLGSRPGSLGSFAGVDLKIPIITYELPKNATGRPADELWKRYGRSLLAAVVYPMEPGNERLYETGGEAAMALILALLIIAGLFALMAWDSRQPDRQGR